MIDWQLQLTFDNFLRFPIYRLSYSTLFMNTTVCSSACRRSEALIVAVTMSYILLFLVITCTGLYKVVAIYIYKFLPITIVFVCLLQISSLGSAVVHFTFACASYKWFFQRFCSSISGIFYCSF